jgi:hypothetical protein
MQALYLPHYSVRAAADNPPEEFIGRTNVSKTYKR